MNETVDQARERLEREDTHFQALQAKHQQFERRLDELRTRRWLSDEEQIEEARVKKLKLAVRDEMEAIQFEREEAVQKAVAGEDGYTINGVKSLFEEQNEMGCTAKS